jgi:Ribonuclease G/E
MNKELFVSSTPHETKVGLVEDDLLAEIYLERENEYTLAGSIYKGPSRHAVGLCRYWP